MPKRTDIQSILILGAGPIVIGQACEFDYSGAQACKALREEGYRVILVNSNPATIMTDPEMADATYIEPIQWEVVRKIIEKERPVRFLCLTGWRLRFRRNCAKRHKAPFSVQNQQNLTRFQQGRVVGADTRCRQNHFWNKRTRALSVPEQDCL